MSADLYIDFAQGLSALESTHRIGHMGVMGARLTFRLRDALRVLYVASSGVVLAWLPDAADAVVAEWRMRLREALTKHGDNWFANVVDASIDSDWDDAPDAGDLRDLFNEHLGQHWSIRVD